MCVHWISVLPDTARREYTLAIHTAATACSVTEFRLTAQAPIRRNGRRVGARRQEATHECAAGVDGRRIGFAADNSFVGFLGTSRVEFERKLESILACSYYLATLGMLCVHMVTFLSDGLSSVFSIRFLSTQPHLKAQTPAESDTNRCSICQENLGILLEVDTQLELVRWDSISRALKDGKHDRLAQRRVRLDCGGAHEFCYGCIVPYYLQSGNTCPLCRNRRFTHIADRAVAEKDGSQPLPRRTLPSVDYAE